MMRRRAPRRTGALSWANTPQRRVAAEGVRRHRKRRALWLQKFSGRGDAVDQRSDNVLRELLEQHDADPGHHSGNEFRHDEYSWFDLPRQLRTLGAVISQPDVTSRQEMKAQVNFR